jgi:GNAT superfamily N-acetyltransferase
MIRDAGPADRRLIVETLSRLWGGVTVVGHGVVYDCGSLPALLAFDGEQLVGLLTYHVEDGALEIVTINALRVRDNIGSALLSAALSQARALKLERMWLVTTNDNVDALRFYQRRGMRIVGVSPGAVDRSRLLKPNIPEVGSYGIGIHDELTLEFRLTE